MSFRWWTALGAALAATSLAGSAGAHGPYVVLHDDGTLAGKVTDPYSVLDALMKQYDATGSPRPDVLSVWTDFPMDKNTIETLFDPAGNDVKGIGLEDQYPGDGTFPSDYPPLRAMLLHNDVTQMVKRAAKQDAPVDGYGEYLFLLELTHCWGPAARVPATDAGPKDELIGFPFHWSFWMDATGSPAGGNAWKDNGDGTFTTLPAKPGEVTYSMLDLYLMGLADPSEVQPFGVLENAVAQGGAVDPMTGKNIAKTTFPWFGATPLTVTATRRAITIDDVIAANGTRSPARASSPSTFKLGIALVVKAGATDDEIAAAEAAMDPLADKLAPAFERATRGRGHMDVVTVAPAEEGDAGDPDAGPPEPTAVNPTNDASSSSGCSAAPADGDGFGFGLYAAVAALFTAVTVRVRRRVRSP
jgi:hypothetical protein